MGVRGARAERPRHIGSALHPLTLPLAAYEKTGFTMYHQYRGSTPNLPWLSCHASALAPGPSPHPPHTHLDEELLIILAGEVDLVLPSCPGGRRERRLTANQFVYYPANFPHTLRAVGPQPANYLMFKWRGASRGRVDKLGFQHVDLAAVQPAGARGGFEARVLFERPTACLGALHARLGFLAAGAGYPPHIDDHDGVIVLLGGELETLGERARPHAVVHFAAGEPHGLRNPGPHSARYIVFEFHGRVPLRRTLRNIDGWKRRLRLLWRS